MPDKLVNVSHYNLKKWIVICCLALIFSGVIALFWYRQWIYSLPTPVPGNYVTVLRGEYINTDNTLPEEKNKALFLHFFNPDCPCSRFNTSHFNSLVKKYSQQLDFRVIVITNKNYTAAAIKERFDFDVPVIVDSNIARRCGVYSTPQAVLLDNKHCVYYRGNYNRSRYCTDKSTNYAELAVNSMLTARDTPVFDQFALRAYGCSLPECKK